MRVNEDEDDNENEENSLPEAIHQPSTIIPQP